MTLFGATGQAFFDRWTLVHVAFWFVIAANLCAQSVSSRVFWGALLVGAFAWEGIELLFEHYTTLVHVHESWANRWVSDPLMAVVGGLLGTVLFA